MAKQEYQCRFCCDIFMAHSGETGVRCPNCQHKMDFLTSYKLKDLPDEHRDMRVSNPELSNHFRI